MIKFKRIMFFLIFVLSIKAFAKKEHRHHEAHDHGSASLNIAFDQLKGKIEFKAAAEGLVGFEHEAKSEKDKKKLNETIAKFESSMTSMIKLNESFGCVFAKENVGVIVENHKEHQGEHSDFVANYQVECKKDIKGSQITFDFSQFKGLKDIDVTLLIGDLQKSVEIKRKPVTIDLK